MHKNNKVKDRKEVNRFKVFYGANIVREVIKAIIYIRQECILLSRITTKSVVKD